MGFMSILHSAVTIMTPLLLAAIGGLFTELAGMLNIALEGLLLTGAFSAIVCAHFTGSAAAGILAAVLAAMALAALQGAITLKLRANVFITGLAANLFAAGMTIVLSYRIFATRGVIAPDVPHLRILSIPFLERIPVIGAVFSGYSWYVYASWISLFICWVVLYKTPFGFRLRACKRHSPALVSLGLKPEAYRFAAFLISGFACGIGGSFLTLNLGVFVPNISAGKGWIALVVIFLGNHRPPGLLIAAFIFGLADAFSNYAQGMLNAPADFVLAIPSVFTLLVMIGISIFTKRRHDVRKYG
ncbi:MAG: ABC transporter permease [Treponema sp.]|nr:ABC transporter permease [Treponema sp.]